MTPIAAEAREIAARVLIEHFDAELNRSPADPIGARTRLTDRMAAAFGHRMKAAGRAEASAWRPISECPENLRIYVYGWHRDHEPPYDEEAMAWKDQIDGKFYYAPQGGVIDWTPTHFAELMGAPLPPPPEGGE